MDYLRWIRTQWDRSIAALLALAAVIAVVLGWYGVSGKALPAAQIPFLASGAVGGILLLGMSATMWISADMRDEWRKLDEINERLQVLIDREPAAIPEAAAIENGHGPTPTPGVVSVSNGSSSRPLRSPTRVHEP